MTDTGLRVVVESPPQVMGCPACGLVVHSHGRGDVQLVDVPCFGRPVELGWRKRTWRCREPACAAKGYVEQDDGLAAPRALAPHRPRAPHPRQLPTTDAAHRRRTHQPPRQVGSDPLPHEPAVLQADR